LKLGFEIRGDSLQVSCYQPHLVNRHPLELFVAGDPRQRFGNCEKPLPGIHCRAYDTLTDQGYSRQFRGRGVLSDLPGSINSSS
jgi:hypothetical protein